MWYVLQVKTGGEDQASAALQRQGFLVRVPKEERMIRSGGAWGTKMYTLFPGYVFLNLDYNADNYYRVKAVPGVLHFLGNDRPSPLTYLEAEWIKTLSGPSGQPLEPTKVQWLPDGSVKILGGVLLNFIGRPIKYDRRSRKATLEITMCGQVKQVTLSILPVEEPPVLNDS
jgi:transcriptional antiterminator NusG